MTSNLDPIYYIGIKIIQHEKEASITDGSELLIWDVSDELGLLLEDLLDLGLLFGYFVVLLEEGSGLLVLGFVWAGGLEFFSLVDVVEVVNAEEEGRAVDQVFQEVGLFDLDTIGARVHLCGWLFAWCWLLDCYLLLLQRNLGLIQFVLDRFSLLMYLSWFLDLFFDNCRLFFNLSLKFLLSLTIICRHYLRGLDFRWWYLFMMLLGSLQAITLKRAHILQLCIPCLQALPLYPIKYGPDDRLRIKPMNLLMQIPICIMDGSIGKRRTSDILHAMLRIRRAIEIIDLEAPLLFMLQLINHLLEVATKSTMRREIFDDLEGCFVIDDQLLELLGVDQVRVRLVPFLSIRYRGDKGQEESEMKR